MTFAPFLSGAFMMALATIGLVFMRTWRETGDPLFRNFGVAFWLFALERIPLALFHRMKEPGSLVYLLRLLGFVLILGAIIDRNWGRGEQSE